jgi:hypothetical protein
MNFLQPALSFALALVAVPFVLHLFTRRKFTDVPFSALIFLKQSQRRSMTRLTLHNLLVLLCRALAVGLLAAAFMMPSMRGRSFQFLGGRTRVALAVVLDNSYSMNWERSGVSLFERARAAALQTLDSAGPDDEILFITTCGPHASTPLTAREHGLKAISEAVRKLAPGGCAGDLTAAVNRATHELERSGVPDRRVVVLSDMQRYALRGRVRKPGSGAPEILFADLGAQDAAASNIGIESVSLPVYPLHGDAVPICFTLRGGSEQAKPIVSLAVNGRARGEQAVAMAVGRNGATTGRGCFRPTFNEPGLYPAALSLQGDALSEDNEYRFVIRVHREMRVLLVAEPGSAADPAHDAYYIERAFRAARGAGTGAAPLRLDFVLPDKLAAQDFQDVRVAVIPGRTPLSWDAAGSLRDFALEGGGLLVFSDATAVPGEITDKLFFSGGTVLSAADILGGQSAEPKSFTALASFDAGHVVFRDFTGDMGAQIASTRFLAPGRLVVNGPDVRVLATLAGGAPVLVERPLGRGRVALLASGVNPYVSNMALKTYFVPFLFNMVKYLGQSGGQGRRIFTGGEAVELDLDTATGAPELAATLRGRAGRTVPLSQTPGTGGLRYRSAGAMDPGLYEVRAPGGEGGALALFAVNADPAEGALERMPRSRLGKAFADYRTTMIDASRFFPADRVARWSFNKEHSYLWIPFALGALLFLGLDTLISNRS